MLSRKRQRPNPTDASSVGDKAGSSDSASQQSNAPPRAAVTDRKDGPSPEEASDAPSSLPSVPVQRQVKKTRSWYGSWPRVPKATTSTQLTRENILGGTLQPQGSADFSRYEVGRASDTASIGSGTDSMRGTLAPAATAGEVKKVPDGASGISEAADTPPAPKEDTGPKPPTDPKIEGLRVATGSKPGETKDEDAMDEDARSDATLSPNMPGTPMRPSTPVGWLGWLWPAAPEAPTTSGEEQTKSETRAGDGPETKAGDGPETKDAARAQEDSGPPTVSSPEQLPPSDSSRQQPNSSSTGWFGFWSSTAPSTPPTAPPPAADPESSDSPTEEAPEAKPASQDDDAVMPEAPPPCKAARTEVPRPSAGSTWAFWSRDLGPERSGASTPRPEPGEIAVIGDKSETHPEPANRSEVEPANAKGKGIDKNEVKRPAEQSRKKGASVEPKKDVAETPAVENEAKSKPVAATTPTNKSRRGPPQPVTVGTPAAASTTPKSSTTTAESSPQPGTSDLVRSSKTAEAKSDFPTKQGPPNLLLPTIDSVYRMKETPGIARQLGRLLLRASPVALPFQPAPTPAGPSVFRTKSPPKIRRALAIGVHGLFPGAFLRSVMGQPTGTSLRFAGLCADAIRRWADRNGSEDCEIEKIALEGEGKIAERVDNLWKLLLNWIDHLKNADFIVIACHSQGVPVGVMLLAKLIGLGIVKNAKVGICAMAGVSLGPFPPKYGGILMGPAAELLEFSNPKSDLSQRYEQALAEVLRYGVRITFVGSIDDQLVPMESSINSPLHHPYIYRAVFIDGRIHAPDFITHLISFALKLRNIGVSDHGLIRELSAPLAASLSLFGEGHSRLYFEDQVYDLALSHALETTDLSPYEAAAAVPEFRHPASGAVGVANNNPYHLPWLMRGLLAEDLVRTELSAETDELLKKFDDWSPATPKLKDVKYRLEAIRSRL